jgi:hypothetical protein
MCVLKETAGGQEPAVLVPCICSVAAPPWAQVLGLCPGLPQVQARERGRVPCSHRIWSLAALHGIPGRRWYSGGEWVHPQEARPKTNI